MNDDVFVTVDTTTGPVGVTYTDAPDTPLAAAALAGDRKALDELMARRAASTD